MEANALARQLRDGLYLLKIAVFGAHGSEDGVNGLFDQINLHCRDEVGTHYRQAFGIGLTIIAAEQEVDRRRLISLAARVSMISRG